MTGSISDIPSFLTATIWQRVNRNLLAKSLAELMREQVANPEVTGTEADGLTHMRLSTDHAHIFYTFSAYHRQLDYWHIVKSSITRHENGNTDPTLDTPRFFIEMQHSFRIQPFTLARYTEELLHTLYADAYIEAKGRPAASEIIQMDHQDIEHLMNGHPWIIVNKGRLGFSQRDYHTYAPETGTENRLFWVAAHTSRAIFHSIDRLSREQFYRDEIDSEQLQEFNKLIAKKGGKPDDYVYIPVHPWQWNAKLAIQFAPDIAENLLIPLGYSEPVYSVQQSIRTLLNTRQPDKYYVKTALSILNTGYIRGLIPKHMYIAPRISQWIKKLYQEDPYLQATGLDMLGEFATVTYLHPHYNAITDAPYQYNEMLGALWRESAVKYLKEDEKLMTMAALLYVDNENNCLVAELARQVDISVQQWLSSYFRAYLKPLLHLDYQHSVYVTPHGENIILVLKDGLPTRIIIKDFVDEVLATPKVMQQLPKEVTDLMNRPDPGADKPVPLFILIGVFDAFFRYLSDILHTYAGLDEKEFWTLVNEVIEEYQAEHPEMNEKFERYNLYTPQFDRLYLNRYRIHDGYEDKTDVMPTDMGSTLDNPLLAVRQADLI